MNSGLTSHQQRGHTETGPRFKVSSERPEKRGIDLATPGLVVQRVIHYTTAAQQHDLYVNNLVGDIKANPRDFYQYINSQEKDMKVSHF